PATTFSVADTLTTPAGLTAFTIYPSGCIEQGWVIAEFDATVCPDGLTIDAEDGVWVASPFGDEIFRVDAGGAITDRLPAPHPYSLALGGSDGRDLFVCASETWIPEEAERDRSGTVRRIRVQVPAAQA
ncbi:SMP-30/gluconolactonase/LRE family protein, partial [Rhodococcus sp. NPDC058514]|uniref:SMP-30/gluconolactonase/LRE family protein n=1 Tax=Rhodococcus sp. NPDC058514 TaxID=3346532 RepID=UPI003669B713